MINTLPLLLVHSMPLLLFYYYFIVIIIIIVSSTVNIQYLEPSREIEKGSRCQEFGLSGFENYPYSIIIFKSNLIIEKVSENGTLNYCTS